MATRSEQITRASRPLWEDEGPLSLRCASRSGSACTGVAAGWYALGRARVEYLDCDLLLAPDAAYLEDEFVAEDLRGLGVADGLASFRSTELRRERCTCSARRSPRQPRR